MKLVSWNIQWSRGVDGVVDTRRIADTARQLADFDVLCLQEVAAGFPELPGSAGEDQFALFAALLPDYVPIATSGVDIHGASGRRRFGNLILSRLPVLRVLHHQLPWPADPTAKSMPRTASAVTLGTPVGPLVVVNTHLEHFSALQRAAQIEALRSLHAQNCQRVVAAGTRDASDTPYHVGAENTRTLLTGDFNLHPLDPLHARLQQPFAEAGVPCLVDAWRHLHGDAPHPPNAGLFDRSYFIEPFASDYFFASADLLPYLCRFAVDAHTQASDHQPQLLELNLELH